MRKHLPLLLAVLAVVAGYVLLTGDDDVLPEPPLEDGLGGAAAQAGDLETATRLEAEGIAPSASRRKKRRAPLMPVDPRTLPKGILIVKPLGPDLQILTGSQSVRLRLHQKGHIPTKLPLYDEEDGTWRFERIIAGPVSVRAEGDHIVACTLEARVKANQETVVELHLEVAGAVTYDVLTYAKTRPEKVRLELFDYADKPVEGWFQQRSTAVRAGTTSARKAKAITQGPTGVVFGLRPGPYMLKVTNVESEEWDSARFEIEAGKTRSITLEVRR